MEQRALGASAWVAACLAGWMVFGALRLVTSPERGGVELVEPLGAARVEEVDGDGPRDAARAAGRAPPAAAAPISTAEAAAPTPSEPTRRRLLVLHGACMTPESTFTRLDSGLPEDLDRRAPEGNARCADGSADWVGSGSEKAAALEDHLTLASRHDNVIVGFSRGAFVARDVALARPARFSGLVFIGATMKLDVGALRAAGVRRVVLASGELDSAYASMRRNRDALERGGIEARFVSLGRVYHTLPSDAGERLRGAIAWVAEVQPPS